MEVVVWVCVAVAVAVWEENSKQREKDVPPVLAAPETSAPPTGFPKHPAASLLLLDTDVDVATRLSKFNREKGGALRPHDAEDSWDEDESGYVGRAKGLSSYDRVGCSVGMLGLHGVFFLHVRIGKCGNGATIEGGSNRCTTTHTPRSGLSRGAYMGIAAVVLGGANSNTVGQRQ
ncbi:hypothetical protein ACA910_006409 [Epithemia clementina (nom. ined.)]